MKSYNMRIFLSFIFFVAVLPLLNAQNNRTMPLDMFLIVDGSSFMENSKNDVLTWINDQVIDRILVDGDKITIWSAADEAQVIYSADVSEKVKSEIKDILKLMETKGKTPDFSGALRDAASKASGLDRSRMSITMLITASAEGLRPAMAGGSQSPLRWYRSERYERWQVLIVAPNIGQKVRQAALSFMNN
jgi:hypothetical protein